MTNVKQTRALRNVLSMGALCLLGLWMVRAQLWENRDALWLGGIGGLVYGAVRAWFLRRRISRRDRRYERNKIFVHYLNSFEVVVAAIAYNGYLAIPGGILLAVAIWLAWVSVHWWTVCIASFGVVGMGGLAVCLMQYEQHYGPVYYQYQNAAWSGSEGLVYQVGTVVQGLRPAGKVKVDGTLWNAVSLSGESIGCGEPIEVIAVERLLLYVDRFLTPAGGQED